MNVHIPACPSGCQAYHTIQDVAGLCRTSSRTVYRWMKMAGGLKFSNRTGSRRIQHQWLTEFMESNRLAVKAGGDS